MKCVKKAIILSLLCLILPISTGCWDNRDITELSIISAVGIDKTNDNQIELTVQIVKPDAIEAQGQGSTDNAFWTFSSTGETIFEAVRNMLSTVNLKVLYSYNRLMVIGEDIAKEGTMDVLDFFERDHETNRRAFVLIAKGISAKEVLNAKSDLESIPAFHIVSIIENTAALPQIIEIELIDLLKEMGSPGKNSVVGVIQPINNKKGELKVKDLKVEGGAVFKKDQLQGWLSSDETTGYLYIINEVKNGIINIPNPLNPDKKVAIEVISKGSKIDVQLKDAQPILLIEIKMEGNIGGQQGSGDLTTDNMVEQLEIEIEKVLKEEAVTIVGLAQECKNDIFGFGEVVHRKHLSFWNTVKEDWDSEFAKASVEIKVEVAIDKSGLIKEPVEPK